MALFDATVGVGERASNSRRAGPRHDGFVACDNGFGRRRSVAERAVRAHGVVVAPPVLDHDPGFGQAEERLAIEQLVAELAVEAFAVAVLPGAAGLDLGGLGSDNGCYPFP